MYLAKAFDTRKFVVHLKTTVTAAVVGDTGPPASLSVPSLVNSALGMGHGHLLRVIQTSVKLF